jgi:hypothetical protein
MSTDKIVSIRVYWDLSDWENQSFVYCASHANGVEASGSLQSSELREAVYEVCWLLSMDGIEQDFALSTDDCGYAIWSALGCSDSESMC